MSAFAFFNDLLEQSGWNLLTEGGGAMILTGVHSVRQAVLKLEQNVKLQKHRRDDLRSGLRELLENYLDICFQPVELDHLNKPFNIGGASRQTSSSALFGQQETFLKLLLSIEAIQPEIFECLVQRLILFDQEAFYAINDAQIPSQHSTRTGPMIVSSKREKLQRWTALILNHMRWCEQIYHPEDLIKQLATALPAMNNIATIIDMISVLPALVSDEAKTEELVVRSLLAALDERPEELLPSILDAVSNMCLNSESAHLKLIFARAVDMLDTVTTEHLPILTKFVITSVTETEAPAILRLLLQKLSSFVDSCSAQIKEKETALRRAVSRPTASLMNTQSDSRPVSSTAHLSAWKDNAREPAVRAATALTLLFSTLCSALSARPALTQALFVAMGESIEGKHLNTLDLWLLLWLGGQTKSQTKVLSLIAMKVSAEQLTEDAVKTALHGAGNFLETLFEPCLALARQCVTGTARSFSGSASTTDLQMFGTWLYMGLYCDFYAADKRQLTVAALVNHVGAAVSAVSTRTTAAASATLLKEAQVALNVLSEISSQELAAKRRNARFLAQDSTRRSDMNPSAGLIRSDKDHTKASEISLIEEENTQFPCPRSVQSKGPALSQFLPFLKTLLEDLLAMPEYLLRKLFRMLFQCCVEPRTNTAHVSNRTVHTYSEERSSSGCDDILILLRKYANTTNPRHRRIAIIGYVALLATARAEAETASIEVNSAPSSANLVTHMATLQRALTDDVSGTFHAFAYDELSMLFEDVSRVREGLEPSLLRYLLRELRAHLQHLTSASFAEWKAAINTSTLNVANEVRLIPDIWYPPKVGQDELHVPVITLLSGTRQLQQVQSRGTFVQNAGSDQVHVLPATLRLLGWCYHILHRTNDAEAKTLRTMLCSLLRAPLELPAPAVLNELPSFPIATQQICCQTLFHAVNWQRELCALFTRPSGDSMLSCMQPLGPGRGVEEQSVFFERSLRKNDLIRRFNYLVQTENELVRLLQLVPEFLPQLLAQCQGRSYSGANVEASIAETAAALKQASRAPITSAAARKKPSRSTHASNGSDLVALASDVFAIERVLNECCLRPLHKDVVLLLTTTCDQNDQKSHFNSPQQLQSRQDSSSTTGPDNADLQPAVCPIQGLSSEAQRRLLFHCAACCRHGGATYISELLQHGVFVAVYSHLQRVCQVLQSAKQRGYTYARSSDPISSAVGETVDDEGSHGGMPCTRQIAQHAESAMDPEDLIPELRACLSVLYIAMATPTLVSQLSDWTRQDVQLELQAIAPDIDTDIFDFDLWGLAPGAVAASLARFPSQSQVSQLTQTQVPTSVLDNASFTDANHTDCDIFTSAEVHAIYIAQVPTLLRVLADTTGFPLQTELAAMLKSFSSYRRTYCTRGATGVCLVQKHRVHLFHLVWEAANTMCVHLTGHFFAMLEGARQQTLLDTVMDVLTVSDTLHGLLAAVTAAMKDDIQQACQATGLSQSAVLRGDDVRIGDTQDDQFEEPRRNTIASEHNEICDEESPLMALKKQETCKEVQEMLQLDSCAAFRGIWPTLQLLSASAQRLSLLAAQMLQIEWISELIPGAASGATGGGASASVGVTGGTAVLRARNQTETSAPAFGAGDVGSAQRVRRFNARDVTYLVALHLRWAMHPLDCLDELSQRLLQLDEDNTPDDVYLSMTRKTSVQYLPPLFSLLNEQWTFLASAVQRLHAEQESASVNRPKAAGEGSQASDFGDDAESARGGAETTTSTASREKALLYACTKMQAIIASFNSLVQMTKLDDAGKYRVLLGVVLRGGSRFVLAFLKGDVVLVHLLRSDTYRARALQAFTSLQKGTRQLQHLCAFAKQQMDKVLVKEAPMLKRTLERVLYRCKVLAAENLQGHTFTVGLLKARSLQGQRIHAASTDVHRKYQGEDEEAEEPAQGEVEDEREPEGTDEGEVEDEREPEGTDEGEVEDEREPEGTDEGEVEDEREGRDGNEVKRTSHVYQRAVDNRYESSTGVAVITARRASTALQSRSAASDRRSVIGVHSSSRGSRGRRQGTGHSDWKTAGYMDEEEEMIAEMDGFVTRDSEDTEDDVDDAEEDIDDDMKVDSPDRDFGRNKASASTRKKPFVSLKKHSQNYGSQDENMQNSRTVTAMLPLSPAATTSNPSKRQRRVILDSQD